MTSDLNNSDKPTTDNPLPPRSRWRCGRWRLAAGAIVLLAVGAATGAVVHRHIARAYPQSVMLLQPTPVAKATSSGPVALKGQVGEIFGGDFILQDDSGHALVVTGPRGERRPPVTKDETVTVQGFFDRGLLRAVMLVHADGSSEGFGPPGPPRGFGPGGFGSGGPRDFAPQPPAP
jgi:hypothetical protein